MGEAVYTVGEAPEIYVESCGGDLEVEGRGEPTLLLRAEEMPSSEWRDGRFFIQAYDDDLSLVVPLGASVRVGDCGSDVRAARLAALELGAVGGDLHVREIGGRCVAGDVGGDASIQDVAGLELGRVAGDLSAEGVSGEVRLARVSGDARLSGELVLLGLVDVHGDLSLATSFAPGHEYILNVDGDASIEIPEGADVAVTANVGGDASGLAPTGTSGVYARVWGAGAARLQLRVGGDLQLGARTYVSGGFDQWVESVVERAVGSVDVGRIVGTALGGALGSVGRALNARTSREWAPEQRVWTSWGEAGQAAQAASPQSPPAGSSEQAPRQPGPDPDLAVLEAVARGEVSPEDAERLLRRGGSAGA